MSARERNPLTRWPLRTSAVMAAVFVAVAWITLHLQGRSLDPYRITAFAFVVFLIMYLRGREQHARHLARRHGPGPETRDG